MPARRRKLTPVGSGWNRGLHVPDMQLPEATITAQFFFEEAPKVATMIELFEKHLWPLYRFSSLVKDDHFVPVEGVMDRAYHFVEHAVAEEAEIDAYCQEVMCKPLDRNYPLWQVTVFNAKVGKSAIVLRIHHALGDGLAFLFAFSPMASCDNGDVLSTIPLPGVFFGRKSEREPGDRPSCMSRFCKWLCGFPGRTKRFFRGAVSLLSVPPDAEIKMNLPRADRLPYVKFSGKRTFTRMPPAKFSTVKAVKNKYGCTVNDVIMAAFTGALRSYNLVDLADPLFQRQGKLECKCTMLFARPRPVDLTNPGACLCNKIVCPLATLPIDGVTAQDRLHRVVECCNAVKNMDYLTGVTCTTELLTAILPTWFLQKTASKALCSITCNYTSLPFPTVPVSLFGQRLLEAQVLFVNPGPQVGFVVYDGVVYWNVVADPDLIPDPAALGRHFNAELEELLCDPS